MELGRWSWPTEAGPFGEWSPRDYETGSEEGSRKLRAAEERAGLGADGAVAWLNGYLRNACDSAIPGRPVYWWSPEIADLRRACVVAKRTLQKAGRRGDSRDEERAAYRESFLYVYRPAIDIRFSGFAAVTRLFQS